MVLQAAYGISLDASNTWGATQTFNNVDVTGTFTAVTGAFSDDVTLSEGKLSITDTANEVPFTVTSSSTTEFGFVLTSPTNDWLMVLNGSNAASQNGGILIDYTVSTPNGTGDSFIQCQDATATRLQVRSNGGIANFQSNDVDLSDEKMKTEIIPLDSAKESIRNLIIGKSSYLEDPENTIICVGANQAASVDEDFGAQWDDETSGVINKHIYLKAIRALQEVMGEVDELKAAIEKRH